MQYNKEFKEWNKEIKNMSKNISKNLSNKMKNDIEEVHQNIINQFYEYQTSLYNRYGDLENTIEFSKSVHTNKSGEYITKVGFSSNNMSYKYGLTQNYKNQIDPDYIFNSMWEEGLRGLPKTGIYPLSHSFDFAGIHFKKGEIWKNPFWDISKYQNIFNSIKINKIGNYKISGKHTPEQVVDDFVNKWWKCCSENTFTDFEKKYNFT